MQIVEGLKRVSYSPWLASCVRRLGLRRGLQGLYAKLQSNPGVVRLSLASVEAVFSTRTPLELRCVEGTWYCEKEMLGGVLSKLRNGDVFLDVGSNLGLFSVFAARVVGSRGVVLAFEPETIAHGRLGENVRLNDLVNVRIFKVALSDKRAARKLKLGNPGAVSQSAHLADEEGPFELVQSTDYDSFANREGLPVPKIVKMDVEGHEFAALQGMQSALSNPSCAALFCEIHPRALPNGVGIEHIIELIKSFGFDRVSLEERSEQIHCVAEKESARKYPSP